MKLSTLVEIVSKKVVTSAPVKAVEETCVTCGGAHSWYNCPTTDNNQASVCATTGCGVRETEETTSKRAKKNFQGFSTAQIPPPVIPISIPESDVPKTLPKTIPESDIPKSLPKPNIPYPLRRDDQNIEVPTYIEGYYDSEGDVLYLESLLSDDNIHNLSFDVFFDHEPQQNEPENESLITFSPKSDPLHHEFTGELITIPPGIVREHEDYINRMSLLCGNSSSRSPENSHTIIESLHTSTTLVEDNDSNREEIDIFSGPDDSIPPGIESDFDSEVLNEDECFDPRGGEINVEDGDSFTFVTQTFLPYLTYPEAKHSRKFARMKNDKVSMSGMLNKDSLEILRAHVSKDLSSQAWLWHQRLSHLNFDTINLLSKNDIMTGLPKLKFIKDHLCSLELGKAIKYTWTHFLRSKDEIPEVLIDFLRMIQRGLQAQMKTVRNDRGTKFLNNTL
ncbi:retrovirus-related pol polyprotein from transposon TNT 1-94 [Tanacetum coccineum]